MIRERPGTTNVSSGLRMMGLETGLVACHGLPMHHSHIHNSGGGEELLRERKYIGKERLGGAFVVR